MRPSQRYEILKRDNFTCRYCGRKPPDVKLQVDHHFPRSLGGGDERINLVASCQQCNIGKSNKIPDDHDYLPPSEVRVILERESKEHAALVEFAEVLTEHARNAGNYVRWLRNLDPLLYHSRSKIIGTSCDLVYPGDTDLDPQLEALRRWLNGYLPRSSEPEEAWQRVKWQGQRLFCLMFRRGIRRVDIDARDHGTAATWCVANAIGSDQKETELGLQQLCDDRFVELHHDHWSVSDYVPPNEGARRYVQ